jgi:peptide deformylase
MAARPIVLFATHSAILRRKSDPIGAGTDEARQLLDDLKDTLRLHRSGVGLAAPQIGVNRRAIVVCLGRTLEGRHGPAIGILNPRIMEASREMPDDDGCLSFPGLYGRTVRPHFVRLRGIDENGKPFEWTLEGFDAVVVHHEVDHLNGVLFIDRLANPDVSYGNAWVEDEWAANRIQTSRRRTP